MFRLLKPTRRKAPTEYNMQYKKWPPNTNLADNYKMNKSGKLVSKALLESPNHLKGRLMGQRVPPATSYSSFAVDYNIRFPFTLMLSIFIFRQQMQ